MIAPTSSAALPTSLAIGNGTVAATPSGLNVGALAGGVGGGLGVVILLGLAFFCFGKGCFGKKKTTASAPAVDPAADSAANELRGISYEYYKPALDQPQAPISTELHAPSEAHEIPVNHQVASPYDGNPAAPGHQRPSEHAEEDHSEDARSLAASELSEAEITWQRVMYGPSPPPVEETSYNTSTSMGGRGEMDQDHRHAEGLVGDRRYHEERVDDYQYPDQPTPPVPPKSPLRRVASPADTVSTTWDTIMRDATAPNSIPIPSSMQMANRGGVQGLNEPQRSSIQQNDRKNTPIRSGSLSAGERNLVNNSLNRYEQKLERDAQVAKQGGLMRGESTGLESQMKSPILKEAYRRISQEIRVSPIPRSSLLRDNQRRDSGPLAGTYATSATRAQQQYDNSPAPSAKSYATATSQQAYQETNVSTRRLSDQYQPLRGGNWKQPAQTAAATSRNQDESYPAITSDLLRTRLGAARQASLQEQVQSGLRDSQDIRFSVASSVADVGSIYSSDVPHQQNDAMNNRVRGARRGADEARHQQSLDMVVNSPDGLVPADFHDSEDEMPAFSDHEEEDGGAIDHETELAEARWGKRVQGAIQVPVREVRSEVNQIQQPQPQRGKGAWMGGLFGK